MIAAAMSGQTAPNRSARTARDQVLGVAPGSRP